MWLTADNKDLPRPLPLSLVRLSSTSPIEPSHIPTWAFSGPDVAQSGHRPFPSAPRSGVPAPQGRRRVESEPGPRAFYVGHLLLSNPPDIPPTSGVFSRPLFRGD
ncbi:hypothetical protein GWK47_054406 [Chionoecetes opilio]|uniref:Uncharacterized protein n=1 Tax=Chionoecetes opilio TaxID=41210 RepID=A0A8J4Y4I0_CHIOP|nr:hypothetical protein GWK47_054406 [Chionoecetes opilio]